MNILKDINQKLDKIISLLDKKEYEVNDKITNAKNKYFYKNNEKALYCHVCMINNTFCFNVFTWDDYPSISIKSVKMNQEEFKKLIPMKEKDYINHLAYLYKGIGRHLFTKEQFYDNVLDILMEF